MKKIKEVKLKKDKSDRNTIDKVLDAKTYSILKKLLARNKLVDLQGSICTGKEANVYLGNASTEIYSKFVKNIHTLDNNGENKNIFCPKKLQKLLECTNVNDVDFVIKDFFKKNENNYTLSKRKLRKKNKKEKNVLLTNENKIKLEKTNISSIENSVENKKDNNQLDLLSDDLTKECNMGTDYSKSEIENCTNLKSDISFENMIPVAIKIYKTSAMNFKDRERYLEGEKRFKNFCTKNSRKLIKLWAEKEVRNLKRLNKHNVPSPIPIYLKRNILIMSLIGGPAEKLKDTFIDDPIDCYNQVIQIISDMYNKCNLIHADLSEYNLLYHNKTVYVIDVGQSVERDHINANEFLITDLININNFFCKLNIKVRNINEIFVKITKNEIPDFLKSFDLTKNTFIPLKLDDVSNIEDVKIFTDLTDKRMNTCNVHEEDLELNKVLCLENDTEERSHLSKKDRKKLVKEFNKERRVYKISKVEKKRIFKKYIGKKKKK
ncbi:serine threonine-protein kinase rio1 [Vairimorpha ceranae]|uniref:non-specific serine/threonine protein kinase n=1 Tax=Vairimorpha ceranae TaxID=40302 RepID=A0A0F9ZCC2_9MICR|nr:serine threonine-protein kinase rio1 [Vairimorpha ceranae]KAF5140939.1 hypothetical protein G9O61_00g009290 [Vairimorpha ceranae]KKO75289.1 serine threonine-protein kinase rio1 [Vairimorpha ceranae]